MSMNMDVDVETMTKIVVNGIGDVVRHCVDKKAEAAKYHDDILKLINEMDNAAKTERLKLVIAAVTPLILGGAYYLNTRAGKKESVIAEEVNEVPQDAPLEISR